MTASVGAWNNCASNLARSASASGGRASKAWDSSRARRRSATSSGSCPSYSSPASILLFSLGMVSPGSHRCPLRPGRLLQVRLACDREPREVLDCGMVATGFACQGIPMSTAEPLPIAGTESPSLRQLARLNAQPRGTTGRWLEVCGAQLVEGVDYFLLPAHDQGALIDSLQASGKGYPSSRHRS